MMRQVLSVDNSGLIVSFGDGGDSCCRNFTFHVRDFILNKFGVTDSSSIVRDPIGTYLLLEVKPGIYVRNPNNSIFTQQPVWYNNPATTSRDQLTPVFCYSALTAFAGDINSKQALNRLLWASVKRAMFAQNTLKNGPDETGWKLPDFLTPDLWSIALRGYGRVVYPVVALLDVFMWLGVCAHLWAPIATDGTLQFRMPGPGDTDDDNVNNVLMAAQYTYDTPFSWLARKFYKWFRKGSHGGVDIKDALYAYHVAMGSEQLATMANPIVDKY